MKILIKCDEAVVPTVCQALDGFVDDCQQAIKKKWLYKIAKRVSSKGELMMRAAVSVSFEQVKDGVEVEIPLMIPSEIRVAGRKMEAKKMKQVMMDNIGGYLKDKGIEDFTMKAYE
jgi:hypothetical protein